MSISDKTRKILWASSGSLCAICKCSLVIEPTGTDDPSVVGDECHIRSGTLNGPRYDPNYPKNEIDEAWNLILLCKRDHKMIDDQVNKYAVEKLISIKNSHEKSVKESLNRQKDSSTRIVRTKEEIPTLLPEIISGNVLASIVSDCHGHFPRYCDGLDDDEIEIIGSFFQNLADYADMFSEMDALNQMRASKEIDKEIKDIQARGFKVFAAKERQRIEGGEAPPSRWNVAHILITRANDINISIDNDYNLDPKKSRSHDEA